MNRVWGRAGGRGRRISERPRRGQRFSSLPPIYGTCRAVPR